MMLRSLCCSALAASFLSVAPAVWAESANPPPVEEAESQIGTDPLEVDPLLGFEIETLRRMLNDALGRIEELEGRVRVLEGALQGAQVSPVEGQ